MQAKQVLHKVLTMSCPMMHKKRRESLAANIMAALTGQSLTVTHLGRALDSAAKLRVTKIIDGFSPDFGHII